MVAGREASTPGPTSWITPAPSWPPMIGPQSSGMSPVLTWSSEWHIPDAASLISTSPAFGGSIRMSSTSQPEFVPGSRRIAPFVLTAAPAAPLVACGECV